MFDSNEPCDKKPFIALWFLHKTTNMIRKSPPDKINHAIELQKYYLGLCKKYGVTVDQVSDSLDISTELASELFRCVDR